MHAMGPVQLIVIGDCRVAGAGIELAPPDCVLLAYPDEATLREVLADAPPVTAEVLVHQLAAFSVFGQLAGTRFKPQHALGTQAASQAVDQCTHSVAVRRTTVWANSGKRVLDR